MFLRYICCETELTLIHTLTLRTRFAGFKPILANRSRASCVGRALADDLLRSATGPLFQTIKITDIDVWTSLNSHSPVYQLHRTPSSQVSVLTLGWLLHHCLTFLWLVVLPFEWCAEAVVSMSVCTAPWHENASVRLQINSQFSNCELVWPASWGGQILNDNHSRS